MSGKDNTPRDPSKGDLDDLQQRIEGRREKYRPQDDTPRSAWSLGMRYGSEFFAGVLAGGGLGLMLDFALKIMPWGLDDECGPRRARNEFGVARTIVPLTSRDEFAAWPQQI